MEDSYRSLSLRVSDCTLRFRNVTVSHLPHNRDHKEYRGVPSPLTRSLLGGEVVEVYLTFLIFRTVVELTNLCVDTNFLTRILPLDSELRPRWRPPSPRSPPRLPSTVL